MGDLSIKWEAYDKPRGDIECFHPTYITRLLIALLFGAKNIPSFMKGMGQGIKELKSSIKGD